MKPPEPHIDREDRETEGRYVIHLENGPEAEMTYRRIGAATIAIDHTRVPPAYRGQGIAEKLVARGIADARAEGLRIVPICSYVAAQFRRHPDWDDVLAKTSEA